MVGFLKKILTVLDTLRNDLKTLAFAEPWLNELYLIMNSDLIMKGGNEMLEFHFEGGQSFSVLGKKINVI